MDERLIKKYFKVHGRILWNHELNLLDNLNRLLDPISNHFKLVIFKTIIPYFI